MIGSREFGKLVVRQQKMKPLGIAHLEPRDVFQHAVRHAAAVGVRRSAVANLLHDELPARVPIEVGQREDGVVVATVAVQVGAHEYVGGVVGREREHVADSGRRRAIQLRRLLKGGDHGDGVQHGVGGRTHIGQINSARCERQDRRRETGDNRRRGGDFGSRLRSLVSRLTENASQPDRIVAERHIRTATGPATELFGLVFPTAAAQNPILGSPFAGGIGRQLVARVAAIRPAVGRELRDVGLPIVGTPLGEIAVHVVQPPGVGSFRADRRVVARGVARMPTVAVEQGDVVAERVVGRCARSRRSTPTPLRSANARLGRRRSASPRGASR